jgi:phosphocarrier protein
LEEIVSEAEVRIKNDEGLHMRPAMRFVDIANRFACDITVSNHACGTNLKIRAEGEDAPQAIDALRELVEEKMFDEPPPRKSRKKEK